MTSMSNAINDDRYCIGMSSRPEFYAGRKPASYDCGAKHLVCLTYAVYDNFGVEAADAFVSMIIGLADLSAANVLASLYKLEGNEWKAPRAKVKVIDHFGDTLANHDDNPQALAGSVFGYLGSLGNRDPKQDRQSSECIKRDFLHRLKIEPVESFGNYSSRYSVTRNLDSKKTAKAFSDARKAGTAVDYKELAPKPGQRPCW